jgi:hypothetical protein
MLSWLVRLILILSGSILEWFVAKDSTNFSVLQGVLSIVLFTIVLLALVFWPARWSRFINRFGRNGSG